MFNKHLKLQNKEKIMSVKIACDSSADLGKDYYEKHNITVMPYTIVLGEKNYLDNVTITVPEIYKFADETKTLPKTSAINEFAFEEFFEKNRIGDGLVVFTLSSDMSSTFNNANRASTKFEKVHVVDSRNLSTGVGMLVRYAVELSEKGVAFEEIVEKVEARKKYVQASFIVDKLNYLHKGGRCTTLQFLGANLLQLHPSIVVTEGKMQVHKKYKGKMADIVKKYIDDTLAEFNNPCLDYCFVTCTEETDEKIVQNAMECAKAYGFKEVCHTFAGATVSCHCGKNTIGILYFNDGDQEK